MQLLLLLLLLLAMQSMRPRCTRCWWAWSLPASLPCLNIPHSTALHLLPNSSRLQPHPFYAAAAAAGYL
jgi:hypothetical protein